ncbi:glutaredoxin 3 [Octadecabacter sp. 1_MG-2023]|uniref:glutaredoxin 3 n=1 Tax=unclassified Octadecabacter TaxID=196158 RepID=UPI001C089730|nr:MULTISPECIES: glutaredoxin 3 [unclassified Octadecabacter]MBU2992282.1 glutaredoxin 3 [Octadecabacter sp. B2R22]MDO6734961.1 glutaredoxin 3 [Octadecabacter sp. 1_MG-2023]
MATVELYTTPICGFCHATKRLLDSKGVSYSDVDVMADPSRRAEMTQRANGGRTVPQVFIDGAHIGGNAELQALERAGKLDALLNG